MKLEYEDFKEKLGHWAEKFRPFIEGPEMFQIYERLKQEGARKTLVPDSDNVFRAFSSVTPHNLEVVWYLMNPYPGAYRNGVKHATGIALDCSNSPDGVLQPSLEKFYDGMEQDLKVKVERSPDLSYLGSQGIMLLNTDLTCVLGDSRSQLKLWEPFQKYFLKLLEKKDVIYVLSGKESQRMKPYIKKGSVIIETEHPCFAHRENRNWLHENVFTRIDENLENAITWDYGVYMSEPVF